MARFSIQQARDAPLLNGCRHDTSSLTSSITSCQLGIEEDHPPKKGPNDDDGVPKASSFNLLEEDAAAQQQQRGYPPGSATSASGAYMMPMAHPPGMGVPMMYMMPSNCSPMGGGSSANGGGSRGGYYNCNTADGRGYSCNNDLHDTYESTDNSFDSAICAKPCEGVGRFFGRTINGFVNGCTSVLEIGENFCCIDAGLVNKRDKNELNETSITMDMMAETPHPLSPPADGEGENLNEKMDELLKLLKDKDSTSGTTLAGGSGSELARKPVGDGRGEVFEPSPRTFARNVAAAAKSLSDDDGGDEVVDQVNNLIGTFRSMNGSINRFGALDESAISKDSEMLGIGHDLLLDPTVDEKEAAARVQQVAKAPTKSLMDELSFDFNHKGFSITGEAVKTKQLRVKDKRENNGIGGATGKQKVQNKQDSIGKGATAGTGGIGGRPPLPVGAAASRPPLSASAATTVEKENKNPNVPTEGDGARATASLAAKASTKAQQGSHPRSRRGQKVRKMLKDIKNIHHHPPKNGSKNARSGGSKSRAVNITVEDRRNDSSEKISVLEDDPAAEERSPAPATFPAAADFPSSSNTAVDSMGFPVPSSRASSSQRNIQRRESWESEFTDKDNPFASRLKDRRQCKPAANATATATAPAEARFCAWCKKGGTNAPDVLKKLKLCSRCQETYYCSPECQTKDWINGHARSCRPASVAMC
mmetsp:Transcript_5465/g.11876  ORF Transcript_5465/g.11876 Transcript_5465/m.11876 type:complete len:705 (+) Transcript_5465:279-2393(+)|eukprot:CAMPEP_0172535472 /NCGR_PEP_ID=MMETSP1067-20121228/7467_1 /TAXON_ID=265564 ORGANISM="Thalassiosira punctigera, Strain Tpunct2005C2" /NCGR_SAMPLE_ID=MMETSP1067 /ASSEMBLY_ACC=CAM_ASM_000444 /LENGTH=704 /DNA_ID=CAMNT_0013320405 /DNA_START=268 /DNA_END=2382 /DNA_ORIENTATION=+